MKIVNNQDAIAKSIERFGKAFGITAVGDDGSVCVEAPNREAQIRIGIIAADFFGHTDIGDGVQSGSIFINCTVYVRERGIDIQQNAIVGVFLRTLERYRGVLFLTTNRAATIDDAIISRLTAHIRYDMPDAEQLASIWQTLGANYGFKITEKLAVKLAQKHPKTSGRGVKNLFKLAAFVTRKDKTALDDLPTLMSKLIKFQDDAVA